MIIQCLDATAHAFLNLPIVAPAATRDGMDTQFLYDTAPDPHSGEKYLPLFASIKWPFLYIVKNERTLEGECKALEELHRMEMQGAL